MHLTNNKNAPRTCTTEARDADEHAHNLTNWQQQYDQISGGGFYGRIDELPLQRLQVFREHTSKALRQQCNVWPNSVWIGIPAVADDCRINGQVVAARDVMCRPGHCDFELVTPEAFDIYGVVIDRDELDRVARVQGLELEDGALLHHPRLSVPGRTLDAMRYIIARLLDGDRPLTAPHLQKDLILMALLELLQQESPNDELPPGYRHRKWVVDQVKHYVARHQDAPLTMIDLCELTNVSRRTLQYSFDSILGISPLQYLRATRLNQVRRALRRANARQTVADIASYWGFWHLSQFAKDYKTLFGESPSHTRNDATG